MALHPLQAKWFEIYVPREQTVSALEALSRTNAVELELDPAPAVPLDLPTLRARIGEFDALWAKYKDCLPPAEVTATKLTGTPEQEADRALRAISEWADRCQRLERKRQAAIDERDNLLLVRECLVALQQDADLLGALSHPSVFLYKAVFACPTDDYPEVRAKTPVSEFIRGEAHVFFIVADEPESANNVDTAFQPTCVRLAIPDWLAGIPENQAVALEKTLARKEKSIAVAEQQLAVLGQDAAVRQAVANISVLRWYLDEARATRHGKKLCHVTGWVTAGKADQLQKTLDAADIGANIIFPTAPAGIEPPVSVFQAWWTQPFQLFTAMAGTPGKTEIDPAPLLVLIVPLLFGYMFPDVGHGLVLAVFSAALSRRWPEVRFLIPCGISAALFGLLYGEVFGLHDILPRFWVDPFEEPLLVLAVPLLFGVFLMLLGLVFNAIEAYWRNAFGTWLLTDAAVLLLYGSTLVGIFFPAVFWASGVALVWYLLGALLLVHRGELAGIGYALGKLTESLFALLINTFSFVRVGAFALAHAGLNNALVTIAADIEDSVLRCLFFVGGHILLIGLEGLIVFIQTTRLILYEFFYRFLRAEGRIFRPLAKPLS